MKDQLLNYFPFKQKDPSKTHRKELGAMVHTCKPNTGEVKTGGFMGSLASKAGSFDKFRDPGRDPASKNRRGISG